MQQFPSQTVAAAIVVLALATNCVQAAEIRTWTDSSGKFSVEAQLISADDQVVLLKSKDGKTLKIPLSRLSQADRDHLASQSKQEPTNPFEEVTEGGGGVPASAIASLKKRLNGKFSFDSKSGAITLTYDWSSKRQLEDFEWGDSAPTIARGAGLVVPAGGSGRHFVDFAEVTLTVPVFVPIMQGDLIKCSGGVVARLGGASPNTMYLGDVNDTRRFEVPEDQRKGIQLIRLTLAEGQLAFEYGSQAKPSRVVMTKPDFRPGSLEICGGDAGFQYGTMVFTGKVDEKWLAKFVSESK